MKKENFIIIALAIVVLGGTLFFRCHPRNLTAKQCSEVYQKYADFDGIQATFIKNKYINDSTTVDLTMLRATTDSAWTILQQDFALTPPPQEVIDVIGEEGMIVSAAPKKDYSLPRDSVLLNNDLIAIAWDERSINIFSIETLQQLRTLRRDLLNENINQQKKHQTK